MSKYPTDTEMIDFLADTGQDIAAVLLPRDIVENNLASFRDQLAEAMRRHKGGEE
jgi:hypothetical protein